MKKELYYQIGAVYLRITKGSPSDMLAEMERIGATVRFATSEMVTGVLECEIGAAEKLIADGWTWKGAEQ